MISRVAYISLHTCPLVQPGGGDAGGMNVYIHELAQAMARRGVAVDVFTRRAGDDAAEVVEVAPGYRVIHVDAGPREHLPKEDLPPLVAEFAEGIIKWAYANQVRYDVVHSHYWLSGWAGVLLKEAFDIPLANSFHTLGRVKDASRRADEPPSPLLRIAAEQDVIGLADCVVASTPAEAEDLIAHYEASPERLCTSAPGIDHDLFTPGDRDEERARLGLAPGPLALFVGRIQALKGLDVAVDAVALMMEAVPDLRLLAVGGPSGAAGEDEVGHVTGRAALLGIADRVSLIPVQPHERLADYYRAADVLLAPSRSESFGLVAVEAQACGLPVVATRVGGLAFAVADGESGFLVPGPDPVAVAGAASRILADPALAARLGRAGVRLAERFSWTATVDRFLELYSGIVGDGSS